MNALAANALAAPPRPVRLGVVSRGFLDSHRGRSLYHALHGEQVSPDEVWVFCPPLLEEATFATRPLVMLAETLAHAGATVLRFDYEGQGESEGDARSLGLGDWADDTVSVIAWLRRRFGDGLRVNLLALRGGAFVAAEAAVRSVPDVDRMVLLAPTLDGAKYFDECLRAHLTTQLGCFNKVQEPRAVLREQLRRGQPVSVLGHDVDQAMAQSLDGARLRPLLADFNGRVDVVHLPRTATREVPPAMKELQGLSRVTLHVGPPVSFWDQSGRYWELTPELAALALELVRRGPDAVVAA